MHIISFQVPNMTMCIQILDKPLRWRHDGRDSVSNHQPHDCLFNRLFRRKSKKTPKLRVTGLCAGNSPGTGEFPAQMASNAENVSIWWRHHDFLQTCSYFFYILERLHISILTIRYDQGYSSDSLTFNIVISWIVGWIIPYWGQTH